MVEDINETGGRDALGRFNGPGKQNLGRPQGAMQQSTIGMLEVRDAIVDAFHKCDGKAVMAKLAKEYPVDFMKLIIQVLPKHEILEMSVTNRTLTMCFVREPSAVAVFKLFGRSQEIAGDEVLNVEHVSKAIAAESEEQESRNKRLLEAG